MTATAWQKAYERFEGGYGDPPDFTDPTDRTQFLQLLEDAVRDEVMEAIAAAFKRKADELEAAR